jgi:hypothetical protein
MLHSILKGVAFNLIIMNNPPIATKTEIMEFRPPPSAFRVPTPELYHGYIQP